MYFQKVQEEDLSSSSINSSVTTNPSASERYTDFDDDLSQSEDYFLHSSDEFEQCSMIDLKNKNDAKPFENEPVNQLMMITLLEHICSLYTKNEEESSQLFALLCKKLNEMKLIPKLNYLDEFKAIRTKYNNALTDLMKNTMFQIQKNNNMLSLNPRSEKQVYQVSDSSSSVLHNSWFYEMFRYMGNLGEGGFGMVLKAQNKLDKELYAVKKIRLHETRQDECLKTLREVRVFSALHHENIVRYHSSWLEYDYGNKSFENFKEYGKKGNHGITKNNVNMEYKGNFNWNSLRAGLSNSNKYLSRSLSAESISYSDSEMTDFEFHNKIETYQVSFKRFQLMLFIQMELCEKTLHNWLAERNSSITSIQDNDWLINIKIFQQILYGVQYLHAQGLLHRDLKPANIFMNHANSGEYIVKIGDFGLAKLESQTNSLISENENHHHSLVSSQSLSQYDDDSASQTIGVGTATYAAPEQKNSTSYTNKVDIYSLGIILYELFKPFATQMERSFHIRELLNQIVSEDVNKKWPQEVKLIRRMIKNDPSERPSATEILESNILLQDRLNCAELKLALKEKELEIEKLKKMLIEKEMNICKLCQKNCNH